MVDSGRGDARRPTSADVAREAGLSRATVGYVLNNVPHQTIPEPTRQRVLAAARKLGYTPSAAARSLRSGRSDLVLCLLPDWPVGPSVAGLMSELSTQLEAHGLVVVSHQRAVSSRPLAELWKSINPAAVLVLDQLAAADIDALTAAGLTVSLAVRDGPDDVRMLAVADERVGQAQVSHLAERSRTRIGYAFPADERVLTFARPRLRGVRQACADLGLPAPDVRTVELESDSTSTAVAAWSRLDPPVDGICSYNDELAIALLAALHRGEQRVPEDVAVVGVDDIPLARVSDPPLTTIRSDVGALARYLTDTVLADLRRTSTAKLSVGSEVVEVTVRGSS